jgi:glycosyltransferase involved in cell wall biosynthesis
VTASKKERIAFNLAFIETGPLTGPGYYAMQLFEYAVAKSQGTSLIAYVQNNARHHFSALAQQYISPIPNFRSRISRVLYEQFILPLKSCQDDIDLLFSPAFVSPMWGAPILIATICDMYYAVIPEAVERFQRQYWKIFIPMTARVCDRLITISQNSKIDIERIIPAARGKVTSIPLASRMTPTIIDIQPETRNIQRARASFLMVANLTPNKNPGVVAEAIAKLSNYGIDAQLVHVGRDHLGLLADAARKFRVESRIIKCDKVSDAELQKYYTVATAVIVASLYEGFGMPVVEAQAMGAPLICSDRSALPEAAGNGALFFDPENSDELAMRMRQVIEMSSSERLDLIARGRANAATMSWQRTAEETIMLFRTALAENVR